MTDPCGDMSEFCCMCVCASITNTDRKSYLRNGSHDLFQFVLITTVNMYVTGYGKTQLYNLRNEHMLHLHNIMEGIQMLNFVDTHAEAIYGQLLN